MQVKNFKMLVDVVENFENFVRRTTWEAQTFLITCVTLASRRINQPPCDDP